LPPGFEEELLLTLEDHPYLVDHSTIRQPEGWECTEDLSPVVPLAMTIELLSEIALKHASDRKLLRVSTVSASRWINLERPFKSLVKGRWKTSDTLELNLKGHAKAEFTFGNAWLELPPKYLGEIDIGPAIMDPVPTEVLYDAGSFHGPRYQCSIELLKVGERGLINLAQRREGKGSLLDVMGQQLGFFLYLTQPENAVFFPVRLGSLDLYADIFDQEGIFEHTMIATELTETTITGDMVLKRDGKIWAVARDYVCQRLQSYLPILRVTSKPQHNLLAEQVAPGVYHFSNIYDDNILSRLLKRYLNTVDRGELGEEATLIQLRACLDTRVALKDAVRAFAQEESGADEMLYPIEVFCAHGEKGRPVIYGQGKAAALLEGIQASFSYADRDSVAIVAREPVGIDIEKIEEKAESFYEGVFTERERELLSGLEQPQGAIRFWVAKEACAKKAGVALKDNLKRFEVTAIDDAADGTAGGAVDGAVDGAMLILGSERVQTMNLGDTYLAGWTI
jgi:phosphopantetheinyl transferase (holo-ACP synthase)